MSRLEAAFAKIDAANSADPTQIDDGGTLRPAELVYGERMSKVQGTLYPDASDALQLAVRAQHLRRWEIPRASYPQDRVGYLRWRTDLKRKHAEWAGEILAACGYGAVDIDRVGSLIRKENLKQDAEAQALEDVAALVFLEFYALDFAGKHEAEKVKSILAKTFAKMSPHGRHAALGLQVPEPLRGLVNALAGRDPVRPI
ncbi:MAG: DUF4202 domain-containing protein [Hyphomicrobium sp.]|jgi:hypothetical protein